MKKYLQLTAFTYKAVFLIIFLFFVTSCDELNDGIDPQPAESLSDLSSMSFGRTDLRPFQIASVTFQDVDISISNYTGSFGGMEVELEKVNSSTLAFMVPGNIEPGLVSLELTIDNKSYKASISILENIPLSDPQKEFDRIYEELLNDDIYSGVNVAALNTAREEFYNLSEEDQRQAAQMLVNNNFAYEQLEAELKRFESITENGRIAAFTCGDKCMVVVGGAVAIVTAAMSAPVAAVGLGVFIGTLFEPVSKIIKEKFQALIKEVNQGLELAFGLGYNRMAKTTELVYDKANNMLNNRTSSLPDTIYLKEDEALNLSLKLYKTPLISEMNRGNFYLVDQLLDLIYQLQDKLTNIYTIASPPDEVIKEYTDGLEKFTLFSDNENIVIDGLYGTPEEAQVYFITGEAKDQPFNLTIAYEDENSDLTEVSLTLKLETYELKKYLMLNDNGLWGYSNNDNWNHFEEGYHFQRNFNLHHYTLNREGYRPEHDYNWQVLDENRVIFAGVDYSNNLWYEIWTITEKAPTHFKYTICKGDDSDDMPECSTIENILYEDF